ncbi:PQQ-dependent sugar dehydrogenase [Pseudomonas turukhanskensis]|uniref:Sorbosone dehydrogenase n=1 Tax=Pseudomonas turukhanskensis TaxID=1806536 RepID=A0A9W6K3S6_9PSED|nr:sorbosone dehydrogenase family protein [Pseudomonas turukhanskensis]GLK87200.1 sorbosone dehydrogenase [Pseudomonas turukhanskensis]
MPFARLLPFTLLAVACTSCADTTPQSGAVGFGPNPTLPAPESSLVPTVNVAKAIGWAKGATPTAAAGTQVNAFAEGLDHPRWLYVLPNGDVLVAESNTPPPEQDPGFSIKNFVAGKIMEKAGAGVPSANRITLLRDADHDGVAEVKTAFMENLHSPFGMTLVGNDLYIANANALVRVPYVTGQTQISEPPTQVTALPAGLNHHWTKNVIASADGKKLYVTVGSNSNVGENGLEMEEGRAAIWEVNPTNGDKRLFATGLRNPNGLAWEPSTGKLWTAVNERDELGNDLVPDYITSVQDGGFYGWPYSYYGQHVDERVKPQKPELVAKALVPDYALGAHTASLGIVFGEKSALPERKEGLFVAQHGSWNRDPRAGYKVIFVPFSAGMPKGEPVDVLTGFLDAEGQAQGRPVDVANDSQGALLVTDDVGNKVWRVSASK